MKTADEILSQYQEYSVIVGGESTYKSVEAVAAMEEYADQFKQPAIMQGDVMFSFNDSTPEKGRNILYLLGNGIDGVKNCRLVTGEFDPMFGDFSKDKDGSYEYVTYWKYL